MTLDHLKTWADQPLDPPARLAVIGDPVRHSKSPAMMQPAIDALGHSLQYVALQVAEGAVATCIDLMRQADFLGTNVTVPHKFAALEACDELDESARQLGAVNTILFQDGLTYGFNTDGPGYVRAIREDFQIDLRDLRVLILGAGGGAGAALARQCALEGCERIVLANRTLEKAEAVARDCRTLYRSEHLEGPMDRILAIPLEDLPLREQLEFTDLVIQATSIGLKPTDPSPLSPSLLSPHLLVSDLIYRDTKLLRAAHQAGCRIANGQTLLLHQGALAFTHWFGQEPDLRAMRACLT
ncbi:MAG: shikimate dehydrogenase [Verrucomicrobiota bacterium]